MKPVLATLFLAGLAMVLFRMPWTDPEASRSVRFPGEEPVLAMTFHHNAHFTVACATCHHEFVDGTTGPPCINCHVTDPTVAHRLETQFHTLCRDCHAELASDGETSGPTRRCIACHLPDNAF